ncbi:Mediator of RNA polymerase II transcription subunit 14 [Entamoeba marina]
MGKTYLIRLLERVINSTSKNIRSSLKEINQTKRNEKQQAFIDFLFENAQILMKALVLTRYYLRDMEYIRNLDYGIELTSLNVANFERVGMELSFLYRNNCSSRTPPVDIINLNNYEKHILKTTRYLRKYFYLHYKDFNFDSIDIQHGLLVCKGSGCTIFLTLKNPNIIHCDEIPILQVVAIYPHVSDINWNRLHLLHGVDYRLKELNIKFKLLPLKKRFPYITYDSGANENQLKIYYWGMTAAVLPGCPKNYLLLNRPCLIYIYNPIEHTFIVKHDPPLPFELDSTEKLFEQIRKVADYLVSDYKNLLRFESTSLYEAPFFEISPLTGVVRLFKVGLPDELLNYFSSCFSIGINNRHIIDKTIHNLMTCLKYASIHSVSILHDQSELLVQPKDIFFEMSSKEPLLRGLPLIHHLSESCDIETTISDNVIKMALKTSSVVKQQGISDEFVWNSFDTLYDFFFTEFEKLLQMAYVDNFIRVFPEHFKEPKIGNEFLINVINNCVLVTHLKAKIYHVVKIKVTKEHVSLIILKSHVKIPSILNENGDYEIQIQRTFLEKDTKTLLSKYSPFLHLLVFASSINWNSLEFTYNSIYIPNSLRITFESTNPSEIQMRCDFPTIPETVGKRISFEFSNDSPTMSFNFFVKLQKNFNNLLSNVLPSIIHHPLLTTTKHKLEIQNLSIFILKVLPDGTNHRHCSFIVITHTLDGYIQIKPYLFPCLFKDIISRPFHDPQMKKDPKDILKILTTIHSIVHLSLISSMLSFSITNVAQQNKFSLGRYEVHASTELSVDNKQVISLSNTTNDELCQVFSKYFNDRFGTPKTSNSMIAASIFINIFIQPTYKCTNDLSILPKTYFEAREQKLFSFDFQFYSKKTKPPSFLKLRMCFETKKNVKYVVNVQFKDAWFFMGCKPPTNSLYPDFKGHLRLLLSEKQNTISDGLMKIIQVFKDNHETI